MAVIHEMMEFYRVLISVLLLPLLQSLYTPLSAMLNISETLRDLLGLACNAALISHTANRSLNKHGPHSESLAWRQTRGGFQAGGESS